LEWINILKEIIVELLLDSKAIGLVMSLEFVRKNKFKSKKIERLVYVKNMNGTFNKKRLIKHMVEVNIYYQEYRKRTKINVIREQKWNTILNLL